MAKSATKSGSKAATKIQPLSDRVVVRPMGGGHLGVRGFERVGEAELPSFFGHMVNDDAPTLDARGRELVFTEITATDPDGTVGAEAPRDGDSGRPRMVRTIIPDKTTAVTAAQAAGDGARRQHENLDQVATAMTEMSAIVAEVARHAALEPGAGVECA